MVVEDLELSEELPERTEDPDYYNPFEKSEETEEETEEESDKEEEVKPPPSEDIKPKMSDNDHSGSPKVRVPDAFTGEKGKARTFLRSIKQYIILEESKFKDDSQKILWAMSYMTEKEAAQFADNIFNEFFLNKKPLTYAQWEEKFITRFLSINAEAEAMAALTKIMQGADRLDHFNAKFNALMIEANVTDNIALRSIYLKAINRPIKEHFYAMEVMPTTLEKYMEKGSLFDNQWRLLLETSPQKKTFPKRFNKGGYNRAMLTEKEKEEYRKEGKCFSCRNKGHRSFECPNKDKGKARITEVKEEIPDNKAKLRQLLKEMKKEDIMETMQTHEDF